MESTGYPKSTRKVFKPVSLKGLERFVMVCTGLISFGSVCIGVGKVFKLLKSLRRLN